METCTYRFTNKGKQECKLLEQEGAPYPLCDYLKDSEKTCPMVLFFARKDKPGTHPPTGDTAGKTIRGKDIE